MKNVRHSVFETNSSSSHSISISKSTELLGTLQINNDGECIIDCGEFGWECDTHSDSYTKAQYALTWARDHNRQQEENLAMLSKVIRNQTGAAKVVLELGEMDNRGYYSNGYIDHQSDGVCAEAFESEEKLRQFIFNKNSVLETGNDNG